MYDDSDDPDGMIFREVVYCGARGGKIFLRYPSKRVYERTPVELGLRPSTPGGCDWNSCVVLVLPRHLRALRRARRSRPPNEFDL
jgi:hypothetical protein